MPSAECVSPYRSTINLVSTFSPISRVQKYINFHNVSLLHSFVCILFLIKYNSNNKYFKVPQNKTGVFSRNLQDAIQWLGEGLSMLSPILALLCYPMPETLVMFRGVILGNSIFYIFPNQPGSSAVMCNCYPLTSNWTEAQKQQAIKVCDGRQYTLHLSHDTDILGDWLQMCCN